MTELDVVQLGAALASFALLGAYALQRAAEVRREPPEPSPVPPPEATVAPRLCSGRSTSSRVGPDAQRLGVAHRGLPLPTTVRIGRTGGCLDRRPGEARLPLADARFTALSVHPGDPAAARLAAAIPLALLDELLPLGVWRWLEVRAGAVSLVRQPRAEPLADPRPTFEALDRLAALVERLQRRTRPKRRPKLTLVDRAAELRCAYCHDQLAHEAPACGGCGTRLHAECRAELGGCTTAGCVARVRLPTRVA